MDIYTSTDGEIRDTMPPYVGGGHRGRPMNLSYTEEVAGSSPVPPILNTPIPGGFWFEVANDLVVREALILPWLTSLFDRQSCTC